jgi:hypothetical protein
LRVEVRRGHRWCTGNALCNESLLLRELELRCLRRMRRMML